ncbi:MAG: hypothetical protein ACREQK_13440 [Candidatus Binatia bacterium]
MRAEGPLRPGGKATRKKTGVLWDRRPHIPAWYERLRQRPAYKQAIGDWLNASYLTLMKEKGEEALPRIKAVVAAA